MSLKAKLEAVIYAAEEPVTLAQLTAHFAADALEWKTEREAASAAQAAESAGQAGANSDALFLLPTPAHEQIVYVGFISRSESCADGGPSQIQRQEEHAPAERSVTVPWGRGAPPPGLAQCCDEQQQQGQDSDEGHLLADLAERRRRRVNLSGREVLILARVVGGVRLVGLAGVPGRRRIAVGLPSAEFGRCFPLADLLIVQSGAARAGAIRF